MKMRSHRQTESEVSLSGSEKQTATYDSTIRPTMWPLNISLSYFGTFATSENKRLLWDCKITYICCVMFYRQYLRSYNPLTCLEIVLLTVFQCNPYLLAVVFLQRQLQSCSVLCFCFKYRNIKLDICHCKTNV